MVYIYTVCIYLPDWPGYAGGSIIQPPSGHVVRNASQGADRSGMGFSNLWTFQAFSRWFQGHHHPITTQVGHWKTPWFWNFELLVALKPAWFSHVSSSVVWKKAMSPGGQTPAYGQSPTQWESERSLLFCVGFMTSRIPWLSAWIEEVSVVEKHEEFSKKIRWLARCLASVSQITDPHAAILGIWCGF
jgi:hypothetical protein